jgi:hypothetical protein
MIVLTLVATSQRVGRPASHHSNQPPMSGDATLSRPNQIYVSLKATLKAAFGGIMTANGLPDRSEQTP